MRLLILTASCWVLVASKPELYKEKEDFQYSRSSSDDGTKSGYYGAQRGNMGGNYERAHNMDYLAQHQMGTLVKNVDGELGEGANTRTGSVFSTANSRGLYGSGNYDLSYLKGRNFGEGMSYGDSLSHSATSNFGSSGYSGYGNLYSAASNRRSSSSQSQSSGLTSGYQASGLTSGYQASGLASQYSATDAQQAADNTYDASNLQTDSQGVNNYNYAQSSSQAQSDYEKNSNVASGYNYNARSSSIHRTPVRVYIRPGTRVTVPVAAQVYDNAAVQEENAENSDSEILSGRRLNYRPTSNAKHYESSYSYRKEWEKKNSIPAVSVPVPTESPYPQNSELYEDAQSSQTANNQYGSELASTNSQSSSANTAYSSGYTANTKSASSSLSGLQSRTYNSGASTSDAYTHNAYNSGAAANLFGSHVSDGTANLNNLVEEISSKPKSYHSSYSYHKSWERRGDPYVIKPVGSSTSQRLTAASANQGYACTYCLDESQQRVRRSLNTNEYQQSENLYDGQEDMGQQSMNGWEQDLGQQTDSRWENLADLGQQTQNKWNDLENFNQQPQSQLGNLEDLGQQTQNQWDKLDDLGQQTQNQWGQSEDLSQQSQNQWNKLEDLSQQPQNQDKLEELGQQTQNQWDKLADLGQQTQNQWGQSEDLSQQSQNQWNKLEDLSQQPQNQDKLEELGQQTQNQWDKLAELGQRTQNQWGQSEDLSQQSQNQWNKLEDLSQQPQNQDKLEELGQQTQNQWDKLAELGQRTQNVLAQLEDLSQQSQNHWNKLEDLGQQTETQNKLEDLGQRPQSHWGKLEDLGQQTQSHWGKLEDFGQQTQTQDKLEDLGQQTQSHWGQLEELGQQTQNQWDNFNNQDHQGNLGHQTQPQNVANIGHEIQHDMENTYGTYYNQWNYNGYTNYKEIPGYPNYAQESQDYMNKRWSYLHNFEQGSHLNHHYFDFKESQTPKYNWDFLFNINQMDHSGTPKENTAENCDDKPLPTSDTNTQRETTTVNYVTVDEKIPETTEKPINNNIEKNTTNVIYNNRHPIDIGRGDIEPEDTSTETTDINEKDNIKTQEEIESLSLTKDQRDIFVEPLKLSVTGLNQQSEAANKQKVWNTLSTVIESVTTSTVKPIQNFDNNNMNSIVEGGSTSKFNSISSSYNLVLNDKQSESQLPVADESIEVLEQQNWGQQTQSFDQQHIGQHLEPFEDQNIQQHLEPFEEQNIQQNLEPFEEQNMGQHSEPFEEQNRRLNLEPFGDQNLEQYLEPFKEQPMGQHLVPFEEQKSNHHLKHLGEQSIGQPIEPFDKQNIGHFDRTEEQQTAQQLNNFEQQNLGVYPSNYNQNNMEYLEPFEQENMETQTETLQIQNMEQLETIDQKIYLQNLQQQKDRKLDIPEKETVRVHSHDSYGQQAQHPADKTVVEDLQSSSNQLETHQQDKYQEVNLPKNDDISTPIEPTTEKPGFWGSVWNKTKKAKDSVVSWFKS